MTGPTGLLCCCTLKCDDGDRNPARENLASPVTVTRRTAGEKAKGRVTTTAPRLQVLDVQQFDVKDQRRVGGDDGRVAALAVRPLRRNLQLQEGRRQFSVRWGLQTRN